MGQHNQHGGSGGSLHTGLGGVSVKYAPGTAKQWFRVQGSTLYYKVLADGNTEPATWSGQTTDTNVARPGLVGLYGNASSRSSGVLFDQFSGNGLQSDATTSYTYNSSCEAYRTSSCEAYRRQGWRVSERGGGSADGGVDLDLRRDGAVRPTEVDLDVSSDDPEGNKTTIGRAAVYDLSGGRATD